jgi:TPR repeat protein
VVLRRHDRYYSLSAAAGNYNAQHSLACSYRDGEGVARNINEAARWFLAAAEQGWTAAQCNYAILICAEAFSSFGGITYQSTDPKDGFPARREPALAIKWHAGIFMRFPPGHYFVARPILCPVFGQRV